MDKRCVAMLLAGGQGSRLGILTKNTAKPAVPFGGKYRLIDFPLSNCANSDINVVGVLTQYQPLELNAYIGNGKPWDLDRSLGGVFVLPPYVRGKTGTWYKGTANAIYQNIGFIEQYSPKYVIVLGGDHIYKMDYSEMIELHERKGADCTIAVYEVPWEDAPRFGIMNTDENGQILEFEEKPEKPKSNFASMGIYVFNWEDLRKYLIEDELNKDSSNDFGKDIIPKMLLDGKRMLAFPFQGYWKDVGTIESLWQANMDLLATPPAFNLHDSSWRIYARNPILPPHYMGDEAEVSASMITEGCLVKGKVQGSILHAGVFVDEGAQIENSIIMNNARIGKNARISRAIISEYAVIGEGSQVGGGGRIAVVGHGVALPAGSTVRAGEQVDAESLEKRKN